MKAIKAKDIDQFDVLNAIDVLTRTREWASRWDIGEMLPIWPEKVLLAKLRSLKRRNLVDGCACGCRGDFSLTEKGAKGIADAIREVNPG